MKRSIEALVVVPMLVVIAAMAILGLCGIARAEPVQQFGFHVGGSSPARFTVHGWCNAEPVVPRRCGGALSRLPVV